MNRKQFYNLYSSWKKNLINENETIIVADMFTTNNNNFSTNENSNFENVLGDFFIDLFYIRDQSHLFHWQTFSYSMHTALGEFYESYIKLLDELVEMILGVFNNRPIVSQDKNICLKNFSENEINNFISDITHIFTNTAKTLIDESYSEIHNKIDEIIEQIDSLSYKLSLK